MGQPTGRRHRRAIWFIVVCLLVLAATPGSALDARRGMLRPGDVLRVEGISVVIPQPGRGVWVSTVDVKGGWRSFGVTTARDGSVSIVRDGLGAGAGSKSRRTDPCLDNAYSLYSSSWKGTYAWYFNVSTTPSEITQDNATSGVRDAVENITQAHNDCGLPDNVTAQQLYKGTTTKSPNIGNDASCQSSDGKNVVAFGDLPVADLAFTCWWTSGNATVEADVKLNKTDYLWVVNIGQGCSSKYSVEAVATHEFGHAFGLGHVSESLHGTLTMSPVILPCQASEATLGLGDIRGLEAQY